jgi:hypothetical protein
MPVVFLFAAVGWVALRSKSLRVPGWPRKVAVVLVAVVLALSVAPGIRVHLHHPAFGSAGPETAPVDEAPPS